MTHLLIEYRGVMPFKNYEFGFAIIVGVTISPRLLKLMTI